jgi:hypothetical protein
MFASFSHLFLSCQYLFTLRKYIKKIPPFDQRQITFLRAFIAVVVAFIIYLYCQDTINRQFNSTMENNFAEKTACSLSCPGAGVR